MVRGSQDRRRRRRKQRAPLSLHVFLTWSSYRHLFCLHPPQSHYPLWGSEALSEETPSSGCRRWRSPQSARVNTYELYQFHLFRFIYRAPNPNSSCHEASQAETRAGHFFISALRLSKLSTNTHVSLTRVRMK